MLEFVGLGLYDEHSITRRGARALEVADVAYLEAYTSVLAGTTVERLEAAHDRPIHVLDRDAVERHPEDILDRAVDEHVVVLTGGDPMVATTHVDLRLRAHDRDIPTRLVHGTSAATAAAGLTGLQQYRFGRAATVPFPDHFPDGGLPDSVVAAVQENDERGLHTLLYLDISLDDVTREKLAGDLTERCLSADAAAAHLLEGLDDRLGVAVARAGSQSPRVETDQLSVLAERSFGEPLHLLVLPGTVHDLEAEALRAFAGADPALLADHTDAQ